MKFNGSSGVQLRTPRDLASLASYTALKFYLQSPEPPPGQVAGDQFVLYMGSRQVAGGLGELGGAGRQAGAGGPRRVPVPLSLLPPQATGDYMGVALRGQKVHWVYRLGGAGPTALSIDEDIGEEFAAVSIDRWEARPSRCSPHRQRDRVATPPSLTSALRTLQFGHMSVTVENQMVQETKGDTMAPWGEGLLSVQPDDFVFYVGGYPGNFTVSPVRPGCAATPPCTPVPGSPAQGLASVRHAVAEFLPLGLSLGGEAP